MTIEKQLSELTAAVNNLAAVFQGTADQLKGAPVVGDPAPIEETPKKAAPKKAPIKPKEEAPKEQEKVEEVPDFEEVKTAGRELAVAKGRDTVVGLLKEFKVAKASELAKSKWQAYIDRANELAASEDMGDLE